MLNEKFNFGRFIIEKSSKRKICCLTYANYFLSDSFTTASHRAVWGIMSTGWM